MAFGLSRPRLPRKLRRRRPARAPSRLQHVFDALADKHGVCRLDTTGESETTRMRATAARPPPARLRHTRFTCLVGIGKVGCCHVNAFLGGL